MRDVFTKLSEQLYGLQKSVKENEEQMHNSEKELSTILNKIDPPDFESDQVSAMDSCHSGSGQWIFESPLFSNWAKSQRVPDTVLFIHGMPGAGMDLTPTIIMVYTLF